MTALPDRNDTIYVENAELSYHKARAETGYSRSTEKARVFSFFGDYIHIKGTMAKVIANTRVIPERGETPKLTA